MDLEKATELAVDNIIKEGLNDIFPHCFEVDYLQSNRVFRKAIVEQAYLSIKDLQFQQLQVSPLYHVYFPKTGAYDFRKAALIQPLDTIKYLALCIHIADQIENHRPPKKKSIVLSYRFKPNKGYLFDPKFCISEFNKHSNKKAHQKRIKVLIKADISNFYERLNLHRLEMNLLNIGVDKRVAKLINDLLLFWSNRDSYGLPIGSNASRILAEASLIPVDEYLLSHGVNFCRFVDDYRMFASSGQEAHYWLSLLIQRLALEGLTVNPGKTILDDVSKKTKTILEKLVPPPGIGEKFEKKTNPFRIIVGYTGIIPTRFRIPSATEQEHLKTIDIDDLMKKINSSEIIQPEQFKEFIKAIVFQARYSQLLEIPNILKKFPQFTPYTVDTLIKLSDKIPNEISCSISKSFSEMLLDERPLPEYLLISMAQLLGSEKYKNKDVLLKAYRLLRKNAGAFIARAILEGLEGKVSRGEAIEIRQYYERGDMWEKRQIINIVNSVLEEDEKRPWFKNISPLLMNDPFAREIFEHHKKKKRKRR